MKRFQILSILLLIAFTFVCAIPASADNLYASIRGTVTDPTGAVISGVKLTATYAATGITFSTTSGASGTFTFLQIPIGDYSVKAEQSGFKAYQASGIHVDVNQVYTLDVKLALGAATEVLTVEANPVQVQQTDMQLGAVVSGQTIVDIPLNGRNWTQLQQLQPGVVGTSDRFGGGNGAYSGNGAGTQQNSFLINGVDSNDSALNTALVIPSPDSIGEFRMISNTLNPEYGRNSGSVINALIKNGTNQFHGSAFEFYRDTFLDAKSYFDAPCTDALGNPKSDCRSPFHQNEYGGTVGGPIFKDKAFFFFSFQGYHQRIPQQAASTVNVFTTDQFTNGIFTAGAFDGVVNCDGVHVCVLANPNTSPLPLIGDASAQTAGGSPCAGGICPAGTPYGRTYSATGCTLTGCTLTPLSNGLFSTGTIPTANFDPLSTKLVNQFNAFNSAGAVQVSPTTTRTDKQSLGRIDYKLTNKDALWFYGLYETSPSQDTLPFTGTNLPGLPESALRHYQQYSFSWSHTFTPTTLNELRLGYLRFNFAAVTPVNPINPTAYGFTGIIPQNAASASLPVINTPLFTLGFSANGPQPRIQNVYQLTDNFSKVWGHHTIKAGINADRPSIGNPFYNNLGGNFTFSGGGKFSTGDGSLDFLLGYPDSYAQGSGSIVDAKAREIYAYVQDQWQVRPNLTITYGTGYEVFTPWLNSYAHGLIMGAFRPGQQSTVYPTAPPGYVYPGDKGINKYGGMSVKYDLFAPRFGFAWSPTDSRNWSVHGGIGLYYNRSEEELALQTLTNAPFAISSAGAVPKCGSIGFANPFADPTGECSIANPFPFTPFPIGDKSIDFSQFAPIGYGFVGEDPRFTAPRSTNFNLTIERQLDKATILSVGYVGNRGRHEEGAIVLNLAGQAPGINPIAAADPSGLCIRGYLRLKNSADCPVTPITKNADLTWTLGDPVPGASPYNLPLYGHPGQELTEFNSKYDSLQVTLNRRFSNGLQFLAAYTWSRYFDQTSSLESNAFNLPGINPLCYKCMWAPSGNDAPQRFVVSYSYKLPIYSLTHKWKALTDDWNLSGIYTLQHGTPVGVFDFRDYGLTCDNSVGFFACPGQAVRTSEPLGIRDPRNKNGSNPDNLYFNPAAFAVPASGALGTASRNPLYGPGINYGDMALLKRIRIDEARYFEVRFETYNTFNHTNFANPTDNGFNSDDVQSLFGTFGKVYSTKTISTNGEGRAVQIGAKFYF